MTAGKGPRFTLRPLPARTINPLVSFPPTFMADRAGRLYQHACQGKYVPPWQMRAAAHMVRVDANRTPGMGEMDLATAKSLWRHEREKESRAYARCVFSIQRRTWGWRAVMHATRALAMLDKTQTIPYDQRFHLLREYRDAVDHWDRAARIHASGFAITLPDRRAFLYYDGPTYQTPFTLIPLSAPVSASGQPIEETRENGEEEGR